MRRCKVVVAAGDGAGSTRRPRGEKTYMCDDDGGNVASPEIRSLEGLASEKHGLALVPVSNGLAVLEGAVGPQELVAGMLDCLAVADGVIGLTFELGETALELSNLLPLEAEQVRAVPGRVLGGIGHDRGPGDGVGAGRT